MEPRKRFSLSLRYQRYHREKSGAPPSRALAVAKRKRRRRLFFLQRRLRSPFSRDSQLYAFRIGSPPDSADKSHRLLCIMHHRVLRLPPYYYRHITPRRNYAKKWNCSTRCNLRIYYLEIIRGDWGAEREREYVTSR